MGFFSSSKSAQAPSTKVWKTEHAFLKGISREALLSVKNAESTVIITLFPEANTRIIAFLDSLQVPYDRVDSFSGKDALDNIATIHVMDASSGIISRNITSSKKISFFFYGHYPYSPVEKKLLDQLTTQFPSGKICFCASLDDPFFETFGASNLKTMMDTLGMKDDEFIEHKMVDKSIANAMEKIQKKVVSEMKGKSEREWFERNMK